MHFDPTGKKLAVGIWDKTARIFDVASKVVEARFEHEDCVNSVVFSRDGSKLATASEKTAFLKEAPSSRSSSPRIWRWSLPERCFAHYLPLPPITHRPIRAS